MLKASRNMKPVSNNDRGDKKSQVTLFSSMEYNFVDTNTLLTIILVIFLFGAFGWYGRGRWF